MTLYAFLRRVWCRTVGHRWMSFDTARACLRCGDIGSPLPRS